MTERPVSWRKIRQCRRPNKPSIPSTEQSGYIAPIAPEASLAADPHRGPGLFSCPVPSRFRGRVANVSSGNNDASWFCEC
jgi:hypothetical protein